MENKYYTPTIEEFHVGFEYEIYEDWDIPGREKSWHKQVFGEDGDNPEQMGYVSDYSLDIIRVKYLDKEDIQSLGWEGYDDYYTHSGGRYKLVIETFDTYQSILIESLSGFKYYNYLDSIKNKSELKKLMQQLGII